MRSILRGPLVTTTASCVVAGLCAALLCATFAGAASSHGYPRFQPVAIAFADRERGVLAEDDWQCRQARGCQGRLLATTDGGLHWRVVHVGARGTSVFAVPNGDVFYARAGSRMLESSDAGRDWKPLPWSSALVSFSSPAHGWRLGPASTLAHPPALLETRNGGRTWTARSDPCAGDYGLPAAISFASTTTGWIVCVTEAATGYQGKEVWITADGGSHWKLEARTHPIGPPEPKLQIGDIPGFGYPTGATFLADGHGWLTQARGDMLVTADGGHTWQRSRLTRPDTVAAQSAVVLSDQLGFVLLRGCAVRLVRTDLTAATATTLDRWASPTRC